MLQNTTPGQMPPQEIERELQATVAARRELGAEYDEPLVDSFMSKLDAYITQRLRSERLPARQPARQPAGKAAGGQQRLALAIVSIAVLVPLAAIAIALPDGLLAFGLACGAIALINFFFAVSR